jgi:clathrin heavy chain
LQSAEHCPVWAKWLCVREVTDIDANDVIVEIQGGCSVARNRMKADTAVMHPRCNVVALRDASVLEAFYMQERARLKASQLPDGQVVDYWRWIDEETLAFVAGSSTFHWPLNPRQADPAPVFQLQPPLGSDGIMNYAAAQDHQWCAIYALVPANDQTVGKVQLFCRQRNASPVTDAYTPAFTVIGGVQTMVFV